jgi:hypothetical protein
MEYHFELSSNSAQLSTKRSDDKFIEAMQVVFALTLLTSHKY